MEVITRQITGFRDSFSALYPQVASFIPVLILLILFFLFVLVAIHLIKKFLVIRLQIKQKYAIFEVKPPKETLQSSYTTSQLFSLIHGLARQGSWFMRLVGYSKNYSFEIVSSKNEGIRYLLRVNEEDADLVKKGLLSYLPGISVTETSDYIADLTNTDKVKVSEFVLSNHFAFPLKRQDELKEHDPIAYITGSMTKLDPNEIVAFQLVASPINKTQVKDIKRISGLIYSNNDLVYGLKGNTGIGVIKLVATLFLQLLLLPLGLVVFLASNGKEGPFLSLPITASKKKTTNPYQEELEHLVKDKLDQPLFTTSIRLLIYGHANGSVKRTRGFASSLSSFANSYQSFRLSYLSRFKSLTPLRLFVFKHRLTGTFASSVLSVSEVSDIYHFPFTTTTRTEDIQKIHSKELPAPVLLKKATDLDVTFAKNTYGGSTTLIGLNQEERRRHMYILGATGTGKSTMLLSMIEQDMKNGKGLCLIDPHGDLTDQVISVVPKNRIPDVVYFNPDDIGYPMGINLLEQTPDLTPEEALREQEFIAESIISVFQKIYTDKYSGPRMEYILRNTIHTAFTVPDATLFTIYKLLINSKFRKSVTANLTDENLKDFWKYEFAKAGDYQKVKMISPITNKIGRFLFSPTAKRILEQPKSTINFESIMNDGKILLCNLSKGKVGEDNSSIFGVLVMAKLQLAALKRARMKPEDRRDFYLYVDEFQNFATPAFAQILSEARKYRLNAILAHQTTSQLEENSLVNVTLANTGTVVCFRTANPEDERMILPQFQPYVERGEIGSLPSYHFYIRLGAVNPEEPFSGITVPVALATSPERADDVIASSRTLYAHKYTGVAPMAVKTKKQSVSIPSGNIVP